MWKKEGIEITKDWLDFSKSQFAPWSSDARTIEDAYNVAKTLDDNMDIKLVHNKRRQMDSVIDKTKEHTDIKRVIDLMRWKLDDAVKEQVPIFKKLDARYGPKRQLMEEFRKEFLDSNGNLKSSAYSKLKNANNPTNIKIRNLLKELDPNIMADLEQLWFMSDLARNMDNRTWWWRRAILSSIVTKWSTWAVWWSILWSPILWAMLWTWHAILSAPWVAAKMLIKYYSMPSISNQVRKVVKGVAEKLWVGSKLTPE